MSERLHDRMSEVAQEAAMHASNQRIMLEQLSIALNALQLVAANEPDAAEIAQDALRRIVAKIPEIATA